MIPTISRRSLLAAAASSALLIAPTVHAQADWPNRPIKVIVPGPAGGGMDNLLRIIQLPMQEALGQPLVLDFKPGANSVIGMDAVAKSPADGYTLLIAPSSAVAINPVVLKKMPFDVRKDFAPVAHFGAGGALLLASPAMPIKNLQDLVKYAKENPGKLSYGSWGNGSTGHLVMEGIKKQFGLDIIHVPYKTTAQEITDLIAGTLPVAFTDISSPIPHIQAGKLVAVGISGSARPPALPQLPTLSEQGFQFNADGWFGIFAPGGTPAAIVNRLNTEIGKILANEEIKQKFAAQNMVLPAYPTADQFKATVMNDIDAWQNMAKSIDLKMD